ncbi:MAG: hypothetical protein ACPGYK_07715 [Flavobacteriales bacterium]
MNSFEQKLAETLRSHEVNPPKGLEQSVFESLDTQVVGGRHGFNHWRWALATVLILGMALGIYTGSMDAPESRVLDDPQPPGMEPPSAAESTPDLKEEAFADEHDFPLETVTAGPEVKSVQSKPPSDAQNLAGMASSEPEPLKPMEPNVSELHPHLVMEIEEDEIKPAELQQPSEGVWRMDARIIIED